MQRLSIHRAVGAALVLATTLANFSARADESYPFELDIESPVTPKVIKEGKGKNKSRTEEESVMLEAPSGWSLDFKLEIELGEDQGIAGASSSDANPAPLLGDTAWIVLEGASTEEPARIGDTYFNTVGVDPDAIEITEVVEFTLDEDNPNRLDIVGNHDVRNHQQENVGITPPFEHGPVVPEPTETCTLDPRFNIDPVCEATGYGYGANDDLPGFVLISDMGVGLEQTTPVSLRPADPVGRGPFAHLPPPSADVPCLGDACASPCDDGNCGDLSELIATDPDNWTPTGGARNLAGLLTYVSYEIRNQRGKTTISTGMVVPAGLFAPSILIDTNFEANNTENPDELLLGLNCGNGWTVRVDGGPVQCFDDEAGIALDERLYFNQFRSSFTLRAFLVKGVAPDVWPDCNLDGVADGNDAGWAGCPERLSNEVVLTINQLGPFPFGDFNGVGFCLGNGNGRNITNVDFEGDDEGTGAAGGLSSWRWTAEHQITAIS